MKLRTLLYPLAAAAVALSPLAATAMTVQPVVVNLAPAGRSMSQVVTVTNSFSYPLAVELRAEELVVDAEGIRGTAKESDDLLIFPPQAMIQPGQTQSFRVQYVGDPDLAQSKHFYVTVAQLPLASETGQSTVQVLYNFQVLVSIAPEGVNPAISAASAAIEPGPDGTFVPVVTFTNPSAAHGFLSDGRVRIMQRDAAGREIFSRTFSAPEVQQAIGYGLIGAFQSRQVAFPVSLPSDSGTIEATFTR